MQGLLIKLTSQSVVVGLRDLQQRLYIGFVWVRLHGFVWTPADTDVRSQKRVLRFHRQQWQLVFRCLDPLDEKHRGATLHQRWPSVFRKSLCVCLALSFLKL